MNKELLRKLPKIDQLLEKEVIKEAIENNMRVLVVKAVRDSIENYRKLILKDKIESFTEDDVINQALTLLKKYSEGKLKKVINCTGTVIHTNLGRSILSKKAMDAVCNVALHYNNLEFDLDTGKRGSRYSHIEEIITEVTGAEAAMVVNNNAAAVMLALDTLSKGKEAIVSRGELVEIGGSFRIPDVMAYSGAKLVEVGTTNRTHLFDYSSKINENTGVLLKVHTSNYKVLGFTESVSLEEMVKLGEENNIPVMEDIGSGVLIDFNKYGFTYEPTIQESVRAGVDVITFSGDKMLGGPQAGIIIGKKEYINRMKKNQLTRALRIDKMTLAALEATLKCYLDEKEAIKNIPTLNMLLREKELVKKDCIRLKRKLSSKTKKFNFIIAEEFSMVGGGSMPTEKIDTYVIKVTSDDISSEKLEKVLRESEEPIITRIYDGEVIIDVRTILYNDYNSIVDAFVKIDKSI